MLSLHQPADLLDRAMPSDLAAERGVIGSVLIDPAVVGDLVDLRPEHFHAADYARIWEAVLRLQENRDGVDALMLLSRIKALPGDLGNTDWAVVIAECLQSVPYASNARFYAQIVLEKAARRAIIAACTEGLRMAYLDDDTPTAIVSQVVDALQVADAGTARDTPINAQDAALDALDRIGAIKSGEQTAGMMIGLPVFDESVGGLFRGELTILAARPGEGKTALACQVAWHFATAGRRVYHVSLEMNAREIMQRTLCSQANVSSREIRTGRMGPDSQRQLVDAAQPTYGMPWSFHPRLNITVPELTRLVQREQRKHPLSLVIVDYLQLVTPVAAKGENREQQVAKMSRQLKSLAADCEVAVLCLAQLNRGLPTDRHPSLKMLRESGAIEQDADMVLVPWEYDWTPRKGQKLSAEEQEIKDEEDRARNRGDHWHPQRRVLWLLKNRNGECGRFVLNWIPARTLFVDPAGTTPHVEFAEFGEFA